MVRLDEITERISELVDDFLKTFNYDETDETRDFVNDPFLSGSTVDASDWSNQVLSDSASGLEAMLTDLNDMITDNNGKPSIFKSYASVLKHGVLIDDLIQLGTNEPYRMFTSRAEFRLRLRQDNADQRLTALGFEMGVVGPERFAAYEARTAGKDRLQERLKKARVQPGDERSASIGLKVSKESTVLDLMRRPEVTSADIASGFVDVIDEELVPFLSQLEIETKYEGYIKRQDEEIARIRRHEHMRLPASMDYDGIEGLSNELKQKLSAAAPESLARAARIPGMTPAALSILLVQAKRVGAG